MCYLLHGQCHSNDGEENARSCPHCVLPAGANQCGASHVIADWDCTNAGLTQHGSEVQVSKHIGTALANFAPGQQDWTPLGTAHTCKMIQ